MMTANNTKSLISSGDNDYRKLSFDQVSRLEEIVGSDYVIHSGVHDLPQIHIKAQDLIVALKKKLEEDGLGLQDIRINGSAASVVVGGSKCRTYNDLDILFNFTPDREPSSDTSCDRTRHGKMRLCVLKCLESILRDDDSNVGGGRQTNYERLAEAYFQKYVFVQNNKNDLWSLVALRSGTNRSIELKFVDSMKRKYEFSIDSFQLIISEYLTFHETSSSPSISLKFFPTVCAESVYGDYDAACHHLEQQLIATRNPEEIRGGGLLKYCYLRTCNYRDADPDAMVQLSKYMCSRFFIDFSDVAIQRCQLEKYLVNHFANRNNLKHPFLMHVFSTVQHHALCLPLRERSRTLDMVSEMAYQYAYNIYSYGGRIYGHHQQQQVYLIGGGEHIDSSSSTAVTNCVVHRDCRPNQHYDSHHCVTLRPVYFTTPVISQTATIS